MKKFFVFNFIVFFNFIVAFSQTNLDYLKQSLYRNIIFSQVMINSSDYGYISGNSTFSFFLQNDNSLTDNLYLEAGEEYLIVASGDDDVSWLRMEVLDDNGYVHASVDDFKQIVYLDFKPFVSQVYKLKIILKYSKAGKSFCSVTILKKYGLKIRSEAIIYTIDNLFRSASFFEDKYGILPGGIDLCFWGVTQPSGYTTSGLKGIDLRLSNFYVFLTEGDSTVYDLSFYLRDQISGLVKHDTLISNHPILILKGSTDFQRVDFNLTKNSWSPSFIGVFASPIRD